MRDFGIAASQFLIDPLGNGNGSNFSGQHNSYLPIVDDISGLDQELRQL